MKDSINVPECFIRPCLMVPIFDHGATIRAVVESLADFGLPCLIVDDGSGASTAREIDALAAELDWVAVHRRPWNGGRGEALKSGYRAAAERGYTHAIHLDADGQHASLDVPRFLEEIRKRPDALVLGTPIFDDTVPRSRLYGRQISRAMVWFLTLSFDVDDPLCGFRGVPLEPTLRVLERVATGSHMEFDPELVVRLFWEGVPVRNVPTRVVYDPDGISHFDVWWDDVRLSGMYARFTLAMPLRVLQLLWRRRRGGGPRRVLGLEADR